MISNIFLFLKRNFFVWVILLITVFLAAKNYTPHTWLAGWDTLLPEFNFPLAFDRIFNGVWRTDQGLGAVAIQSHMAELPRVIYLWLTSFILPLDFLRYSYFFLMLVLGPLGMYFLTCHLLKKQKYSKLAALMAGLTYLMNLGTLQHFIVPLEMFATQYGLLSWILLTIYKILEKSSRRLWFGLALLSFIASSQAHTATLFYAYFFCLMLFLFAYAILHGFSVNIKRIIAIILVIFCTNAYWLLPNLYAAKYHGTDVINSKVNKLFSPEAFAKNQLYGNVENATIVKSFLFDWEIYSYGPNNPGFEPMMSVWNEHARNPLVPAIGYLIFGLSLVGVYGVIKKKDRTMLALFPVLIVSFVMLLNGTWPMTVIFEKISNTVPLLFEILRFPFTKFSILFMTSMSIFVGYGLMFLFNYVKRVQVISVMGLIYTGMLIFYFLPAFKGNLIRQEMRIKIPNEYFQMFDWFKLQDQNTRVAILPIHSFWNWVYNDWGYQGAGFLQFGISQPILDRDYDRWSPYNEQYQREMSYAIYSEDPRLLRAVLKKYNIGFILFDESILSVGGRDEETFKWAIPGILKNTGLAAEVARFGKSISVFQVSKIGETVGVYQNLPFIGPQTIGASEDTSYNSFGSYITAESGNQKVDPFRLGFTRDERFVMDIPLNLEVGKFTAGDIPEPLLPCSPGGLKGTRKYEDGVLKYMSTNGSLCDHFSFPALSHDKAYVVEITSKFNKGFPLQVCISNDFTRHCDLFVHLNKNNTIETEKFLLPPKMDMAEGYTVNINNFSIRDMISENELAGITLYQVDYNAITGIVNRSRDPLEAINPENDFLGPQKSALQIVPWVKKNNWLYEMSYTGGNNDGLKVLYLSQAYDRGWTAFSKNNFGVLSFASAGQHVLVNNWSNGWVIEPTINNKQSTIYLVYLPQLLEFIGFAFLIASVVVVVRFRKS